MNMSQEPPQNYRITTRQHRIKKHQVTALHLMIGFLLFMMGLVTWLVPGTVKTERFAFLDIIGIAYSAAGLLLIVIAVFLNRKVIQNPIRNQALRIIEILLLLTILVYTIIQQWYLPLGYSSVALAVIIFAYFWERNAHAARILTIDSQGVRVPGFFRNLTLAWQDVSRIILRHAVLTIDCHNNRLYQFDVTQVSPDEGSPEPFHSFCEAMIATHRHLPKDDW